MCHRKRLPIFNTSFGFPVNEDIASQTPQVNNPLLKQL